MTLGEKLIAVREKKGWSTAEAARAAGVNRTTLIQIEGGIQARDNLRLVTVVGLLDAFAPELTLDDFLDGLRLNRIQSITIKVRRAA